MQREGGTRETCTAICVELYALRWRRALVARRVCSLRGAAHAGCSLVLFSHACLAWGNGMDHVVVVSYVGRVELCKQACQRSLFAHHRAERAPEFDRSRRPKLIRLPAAGCNRVKAGLGIRGALKQLSYGRILCMPATPSYQNGRRDRCGENCRYLFTGIHRKAKFWTRERMRGFRTISGWQYGRSIVAARPCPQRTVSRSKVSTASSSPCRRSRSRARTRSDRSSD